MRTRRHFFATFLALTLAAPLTAQAPAPAPPADRFAAQVATLVEQDKANPPADGSILFIGSSIFRLWSTVVSDMAPLPVYNRAFGGSQTPDMLRHFDALVEPHKPRIIVYYCGSNDVNAGQSADAIAGRIHEFATRVGTSLPGTKMIFVSINRSPDKEKRWDVVDAVNTRVRDQFTKEFAYLSYIDVNPALFDANGKSRVELYRPDMLHFHPPAYVEFTKIVKPILTKTWNTR
jgi:lysophospholipase L1-like esterase